jgi:hypothetical protein
VRAPVLMTRHTTDSQLPLRGIIGKERGSGSGRSWVLDRGYANFALTGFYEARSAAVYLCRCLPGRIRQPSGNMSGTRFR